CSGTTPAAAKSAPPAQQATTGPGTAPSAVTSTTATAGAGVAEADVSRCHTSDLSAHLGPLTTGDSVHLVYTNPSGHTCTMDGYGGVALRGPADPTGPVFSLRRDPDVQ